jgi:hypothetical protein
MTSETSFPVWRDRIAWAVITGAVVGAVTWLSFLTTGYFSRPTRQEIVELLQSQTPYMADRSLILSELQRIEKLEVAWLTHREELTEAITHNTQVIASLQSEVAVLNVQLATFHDNETGPRPRR